MEPPHPRRRMGRLLCGYCSPMRTEFALSTRDMMDEAADWLEDLGFVVDRSSEPGRHRLVVHHDEVARHDVVRIVTIVDPAAARARG